MEKGVKKISRTHNADFVTASRVFSRLASFAAVAFFLLMSSAPVFSQEPDEDDPAPPPIRVMSKDERSQLEAKTEIKGRTKLSLELMNARLMRAEQNYAKSEFAEMYNELGGFHALMDNTLEFLFDSGQTRDTVIFNFKRLEIGLRGFAPRLGLIRRELPLKYDPYVKVLIKYIRDARSKAIEPLFGDSVIPQKRTS